MNYHHKLVKNIFEQLICVDSMFEVRGFSGKRGSDKTIYCPFVTSIGQRPLDLEFRRSLSKSLELKSNDVEFERFNGDLRIKITLLDKRRANNDRCIKLLM